MADKPATRLIAKALPRGDGFAGQFALPGLVPDLVRREGRQVIYPSEREAEIAAMETVIRLFNSRTVDTRKAGGYRRMTSVELAVALSDLDITVTFFAELAGVPQQRVLKWLDGEQDIPHSVHVMVALMLRDRANFDAAAKLTKEMQET